MNYKQETPLLGIPVVGYKDRIIPEVEMKKWRIIENLLLAGMEGKKASVFDDGAYRVKPETESTYKVTLSANGEHPAAMGIVGGFYFKSKSSIEWPGLKEGEEYWLYLKSTRKLGEETTAIRTVSSRYPLSVAGHLLMGYVHENSKLDTYPQGKLYINDLPEHVEKSKNPHGETLEQTAIKTTNLDVEELTVAGKKIDMVNLVEGNRKTEYQDIITRGANGLRVKFDSKISHVVTQAIVLDEVNWPGEVAIGYYGQDKSVDAENECKIYSQKMGVSLRVIAFCE